MNPVPTAAPWLPSRPLTRTRQDSGAAYTREPLVTRQIAALAALPDRERRAVLGKASADAERVKEETLVYFVREYDWRGDKAAAWSLLETLVSRIGGHVKRELGKWRLPPPEVADCEEALAAELYERVLSGDGREEFWEVRFWVCLDRRLHAYAEKAQRIRDREIRPADDTEGDDGGGARGWDGVFAILADDTASPETLALRKDLRGRLSDSEWHAVFLKYVEKMPEESADADKATIAKLLGVTGRSVRNYLRRAEKKLLEPAE